MYSTDQPRNLLFAIGNVNYANGKISNRFSIENLPNLLKKSGSWKKSGSQSKPTKSNKSGPAVTMSNPTRTKSTSKFFREKSSSMSSQELPVKRTNSSHQSEVSKPKRLKNSTSLEDIEELKTPTKEKPKVEAKQIAEELTQLISDDEDSEVEEISQPRQEIKKPTVEIRQTQKSVFTASKMKSTQEQYVDLGSLSSSEDEDDQTDYNKNSYFLSRNTPVGSSNKENINHRNSKSGTNLTPIKNNLKNIKIADDKNSNKENFKPVSSGDAVNFSAESSKHRLDKKPASNSSEKSQIAAKIKKLKQNNTDYKNMNSIVSVDLDSQIQIETVEIDNFKSKIHQTKDLLADPVDNKIAKPNKSHKTAKLNIDPSFVSLSSRTKSPKNSQSQPVKNKQKITHWFKPCSL